MCSHPILNSPRNFTCIDVCCYKLWDNHRLIQTHADSLVRRICVNMHARTHTPNAAADSEEDTLICLQARVPLLASVKWKASSGGSNYNHGRKN